MVARLQYIMYVDVVFVISCLYSAVSLTLVREQRFIRIIIIIAALEPPLQVDSLSPTPFSRLSHTALNIIIIIVYMSTLRLVHYALLLIPAWWKSSHTNALSLALDPTFLIHSHKTLDTAQPFHLLKPNWKPYSSHSIFIQTNISTQFRLVLQSCVCVCV